MVLIPIKTRTNTTTTEKYIYIFFFNFQTVERKPGELVGSVCLNDGVPRIVEYSELGAELESQKAPNGRWD